MDGITLFAIRQSMERYLPLKIQRVRQSGPKEIAFSVWNAGLRNRLILSLGQGGPFFGFSKAKEGDAPSASGFCLALRRRLEGGRLVHIGQHRMDRVLYLQFEGRGDLGDRALFTLVFDMAGRGQNMGIYKDDLLEVAMEATSGPRFFRDQPYLPPDGKMIDLSGAPSEEQIRAALLSRDGTATSLLGGTVEGMGKEAVAATLFSLGIAPDLPISDDDLHDLVTYLCELSDSILSGRFHPAMYQDGKGRSLFHVLPLTHLEQTERFDDVLDGQRAAREMEHTARRETKLSSEARSLLRKVSKKVTARHLAQSADYAKAVEYPKYRRWARLLDIGVAHTRPGLTEVLCIDYDADPPAETRVPLDPRYDKKDNARIYWNRYAKMVRAEKLLRESLARTQAELGSVDAARMLVDEGDEESLVRALSILRQLHGTRSAPKRTSRTARPTVPSPEVILEGDFTYMVGRNARENERLLTKERKPGDWWFHAKGIKGAHVLMRPPAGVTPSEAQIMKAAELAARRSEAKGATKVEVDMVPAHLVRKPQGGSPGFVTYTGQRTVVVSLA